MRIIHAIPLSRGVFRDSLSYFSAHDLQPGTLISVPLKSRSVPALVTGSQAVDDLKTALRTADYPIKKIKTVKARGLVRPEFITAAALAADYFGAPLAPTLQSLIPKVVREWSDDFDQGEIKAVPLRADFPTTDRVQVVQDVDEERLGLYKSLIRETFAQNGSVFLCLPTAHDLESVLARLERGISEYTFTLHSSLPKKELLKRWHEASTLAHPVLIIATPTFLSLPRPDLRLIILDREQTAAYKQLARPFLDFRRFVEILSKQYQTKLLIGDSSLRTETIHRAETKQLAAASPIKQRAPSRAEPLLVKNQGGQVFDGALDELVRQAVGDNERLLIIANRRGLAPLVVCNDCGAPVLCQRCQSPVTLHAASAAADPQAVPVLLCHRCGSRRSAKETCATCGSWNLQELGTGMEKVLAKVKELFPAAHLFRLDSDSAKTAKQAHAVIAKYLETPGAILVATEMALFYLREPIENVLVVAIDSMLALPDFRMQERLFNLLVRWRALATKRFVIQTRYETEPLFEFALRGNIIGFYRQEIVGRREFGYPPFKILVKITREGEREAVRAELAKLAKLLKTYEPTVYPSFLGPGAARYRANLLLKLDPATWPERELLAVLKSLPPSFIVNVDPTDII